MGERLTAIFKFINHDYYCGNFVVSEIVYTVS